MLSIYILLDFQLCNIDIIQTPRLQDLLSQQSRLRMCTYIESHLPIQRSLHLPHNAGAANRAELVAQFLLSKMIVLELAFILLNFEDVICGVHPFVAFLGANAAVAFHDRFQLRELDGELEGTAMAVALERFKLR